MLRTGLIYLFCLFSLLSQAQISYIYIEGIKGIPFHLFSQNKEVPALGKNYFIVTYNEAGEKNIDITFSNSNFEKQQFVVDVQSNSSYGFRLGKTDENKFYLIDIVNEGKIIESNTKVNLALSTEKNMIRTYEVFKSAASETKVSIDSNQHAAMAKKETRSERRKRIEQEKSVSELSKVNEVKIVNKIEPEPVKYGLNEVSSSTGKDTTKKVNKVKQEPITVSKTPKVNICPKIATDIEIKDLADKLTLKGDDEDKLLMIKKRILSGCFTSRQVYSLASLFDTQYGRYSMVKFVYPITSDPDNLISLENLFKYEAFKLKLKKLIEN